METQRRPPAFLAMALAAVSGMMSAPAGLLGKSGEMKYDLPFNWGPHSPLLTTDGAAGQRRARKWRAMSTRFDERSNRRAGKRVARMRRRRAQA